MKGFSWEALGTDDIFAGKTALVGPNGPVAIFDFHNYVSALNGRFLLVWHQAYVEHGPTAPVRLMVIDPDELAVLDQDMGSACRSMTESKTPHIYNGPTVANLELDTGVADTTLGAEFPAPLACIDEILILCHSSGVAAEPSWQHGDLALLVANPRKSTYALYPQDWFNSANIDFGYQWVTRVVRDPRTRQVRGEGIRIAPFTLDESLRSTVPSAAR